MAEKYFDVESIVTVLYSVEFSECASVECRMKLIMKWIDEEEENSTKQLIDFILEDKIENIPIVYLIDKVYIRCKNILSLLFSEDIASIETVDEEEILSYFRSKYGDKICVYFRNSVELQAV